MRRYTVVFEDGRESSVARLSELDGYIVTKGADGRRYAFKHGIHITVHSDGTKMEGLRSISTSCRLNPYCMARAKVEGSICAKCYAVRLLEYREGLNKWLEHNYALLNSGIIRREDLPVISDRNFRFESFGDVGSEIHATNYLNIMRKNKATRFSVWTKNPQLYDEDIRESGKPKNGFFIYSSPNVNVEVSLERIWEIYPWIDAVFTVFDDGTPSNCAGIHCLSCKNPCYGKHAEPGYKRERLR